MWDELYFLMVPFNVLRKQVKNKYILEWNGNKLQFRQ